MEEEANREERILNGVSKDLETVLNRQGYSFQYSILKRAEELLKTKKSKWHLFASEFPTTSNNEVSHIDFICDFRHHHKKINFFMVAECKRVDPAKGYWCFATTPYSLDEFGNSAQFDQILCFSDIPQFNSSTKIAHTQQNIMNLGLEVKTGEKGDGSRTEGKSPINTSIGQVLKGQSGFINYLSNEGRDSTDLILEVDVNNVFIPVIFTTAKIFVTQADLSNADLEKGFLPKDSVKAEEKDWVWLNHNRSEHLSHKVRFNYKENNYKSMFFREFTRSIAIVGPKGIDNFLSFNFEEWIW